MDNRFPMAEQVSEASEPSEADPREAVAQQVGDTLAQLTLKQREARDMWKECEESIAYLKSIGFLVEHNEPLPFLVSMKHKKMPITVVINPRDTEGERKINIWRDHQCTHATNVSIASTTEDLKSQLGDVEEESKQLLL